jgi:5'-nucleotidase
VEAEIEALELFQEKQVQLEEMMHRKEEMEAELSAMRLDAQRNRKGYGPRSDRSPQEVERAAAELRERLVELDGQIAPLARTAAEMVNPYWGPLMRTGNDKSHLARQVERYADIYTSRVSNFAYTTPYAYLRSHRGTLAHDIE